MVKVVVPLTARVTERLQLTTCTAAVQSVLEPVVWKVVPVGRVSDTLTSPTWTEGPLLVTVRV